MTFNLAQTKIVHAKDERLWLTFLDGLRGLSVLYVLHYHVIANTDERLSPETPLLNLLRFGHEAVVMFIVPSGFVLTLPLVRSSQLWL